MRAASASTLTSPSVADAVPPPLTIACTRLSMPVQLGSMSPCTLCSLATPAGDTSDTTTVTPAAASARAVELPMPTGLPQPVIKATRASLAMGSSHRFGWRCRVDYTANPHRERKHGETRASHAGQGWPLGLRDRPRLHVVVRHLRYRR